jgi:hypothetical protein
VRSSLSVSGDLTVGAGNNGVLKVRHIDGKDWQTDNNDALYLNWGTRQPVVCGQDTIPVDLWVTGDVVLSSDARLKTDIKEIPDAMEKLQKIRGVSFARENAPDSVNGSAPRREVGVIAQEVEAVFPELVHSQGEDSYKAVNYSGLIGVLVEALKNLHADNCALKQRLMALETALGDR